MLYTFLYSFTLCMKMKSFLERRFSVCVFYRSYFTQRQISRHPLNALGCNRFRMVDKRQATNKRDRPEHLISLLIQTSGLKEPGNLQTIPEVYLHKGTSSYGRWSSCSGEAGRLRGLRSHRGCVLTADYVIFCW